MSIPDDQQFCLRWNNFQANITSQFEALRDDEDFVDVTLACEGQRLEAHKVVLSACSPFFKELFKSNPCPHPIIFMRDVEARHIVALLEFMYAGEVNVAQTHLSAFLRTAESLQIRGLTDASRAHKENKNQKSENSHTSSSQNSQSTNHQNSNKNQTTSLNKSPLNSQQESSKNKIHQNSSSKSNQSQSTNNRSHLSSDLHKTAPKSESPPNSPPPKKHKSEISVKHQSNIESTENSRLSERLNNGNDLSTPSNSNSFTGNQDIHLHSELDLTSDIIEPKVELPDYASDDDMRTESRMTDSILGLEGPNTGHPFTSLHGGMEIIPGTSGINMTDVSQDSTQATLQCDSSRKLHSLDPRPCPACGRVYSNLSNLRQHMRLIHHPQYVTCPLCTKPFKTTLYLKRHLVSFHETTANINTDKTVKDTSNQYPQSSVSVIKQTIYGKKNDTNSTCTNESDVYIDQNQTFIDSNAYRQSETHNMDFNLQHINDFQCND